MVGIKRWWTAFRNFAILFSFVVNFILIIALLVVLSLLFQIKSSIADPLVGGLYSSFVGLNDARIITQIQVEDTIQVQDTIRVADTIIVDDAVPVRLDIPLAQNTNVVLTAPVGISANAEFTLPGGGGNIRGTVAITLPQGLVLPVALNMNVPVDNMLPITLNVPVDLQVPVDLRVPVSLAVPVDIDLRETQLNDVALSLRRVVEPYARILSNLPDDWPGLWSLIVDTLNGHGRDLLAPNSFIEQPWPGYQTGLGPEAATPTPVPTANPLALIGPPTPTGTPTPPMPTPTPTLTIPTLEDLGLITPTASP